MGNACRQFAQQDNLLGLHQLFLRVAKLLRFLKAVRFSLQSAHCIAAGFPFYVDHSQIKEYPQSSANTAITPNSA